MELINPKITILINSEFTEIIVHDDTSNVDVVKITLTPDQLSSALSRLSMTACKVTTGDLSRVGKVMENKYFEFEVPENIYRKDHEELVNLCNDALKKSEMIDWVSDNYYGSQNSFFKKEGISYARTTVRRWI